MAKSNNMFLQEYVFKGQQTEMVIALTSIIDKDSNSKLFETNFDLFILGALVGCYYDKRSKPSKLTNPTTKIFVDAFINHKVELQLAFKFVLLTGNKLESDSVVRLNKAFRNPETDENYKLFEEYVLGGIEEIYNHLILDSNTTYQDYLTSLNRLLSEFIYNDSDNSDEPSPIDLL